MLIGMVNDKWIVQSLQGVLVVENMYAVVSLEHEPDMLSLFLSIVLHVTSLDTVASMEFYL